MQISKSIDGWALVSSANSRRPLDRLQYVVALFDHANMTFDLLIQNTTTLLSPGLKTMGSFIFRVILQTDSDRRKWTLYSRICRCGKWWIICWVVFAAKVGFTFEARLSRRTDDGRWQWCWWREKIIIIIIIQHLYSAIMSYADTEAQSRKLEMSWFCMWNEKMCTD